MDSLLDAALAMARRGYRVFPIRPYGKKPAVDAFQFVATTDEAQLRAWWTENPQYNPGILTTDIVVADIDTKKGQYALDNYLASGGHFNTFVVRTPTGGYHCYFDGPDSKLAVDLIPGVDIRSHNGYVLGPGAYTDAQLSGDTQVKATGWYTVQSDEQVAWCPPDIERHLEPPGRRQRELDFGVELDKQNAVELAVQWVERMDPAIEGQNGDNHTYSIAAALVRDYALTPETAYSVMALHWNDRCLPPWNADELYRKVLNAAEYATGELGKARVENVLGQITAVEPKPFTAQQAGVRLGNLLDPNTIPARPWVVMRLLLRGDVTMLAAAGAAGKSAIELAAACHWAVGLDFGEYKLAVPGVPLRIFIYNAEDNLEEQSRRVAAICAAFGLDFRQVAQNIAIMDDAHGELIVCGSVQRTLHVNKQDADYLVDTIKHFNADVFIGDPLVNMHTCNESDNGEMRFVISTFRRIARMANCAVLLAHHTNKGASGGHKGDAEGIRGAGAIVNSSRVAIMLSYADDEDRKAFGIREHEKNSYVRIDDAKANMFMRSNSAVMWLQWQGVRIPSGDIIGVAKPINMDAKKQDESARIAELCYETIIAHGRAGITRQDMIRQLQAKDELYAKMADSTLRMKLDKIFAQHVQVGNDRIVMRTVGQSVQLVLD